MTLSSRPAQPLRLHRHPVSGHCHRVEALLALLDLPHELINVSLETRQQKTATFLALNPAGQVPVLEDGDFVLPDSNAILVYLATRYDERRSWWPTHPQRAAEVQRWLSVAAGPLAYGPAALRRAAIFRAPLDRQAAQQTSAQLFAVVEATLAGPKAGGFLVGDAPTLADLAMYAYLARADEGGLSLADFPAMRAWLTRVETLPRFPAFPRTVVAPAAPAAPTS